MADSTEQRLDQMRREERADRDRLLARQMEQTERLTEAVERGRSRTRPA
jgi:hypothetical protein